MNRIKKLYIYEIAGDVVGGKNLNGDGFIGRWNEAGHSYMFYSKSARNDIQKLLAHNFQLKLISETEMDYDKWEAADELKPFDVGPLSFYPSWMDIDCDKKNMQIRIDPGVVFGAGTHHTTYKCLEFLVDLTSKENIKSVIDLGTGTGVLALAAAKLGCQKIFAVDNNNLAVETAVKNFELNNFQSVIQAVHADAAEYLETEADLTLANLIMWELEKIFKPGINYNSDWYIVSGINRTEVHVFKQILKELPFEIVHQEMENLWSTLLLKKIDR